MAFKDIIDGLVENAGPAENQDDGSGSISGCFSPFPTLNPINTLILSVFGDNFFPPYTTEYQPEDKAKLTNEKLLQMQLPGGGKIQPNGSPQHTTIADYITPVTGLLGSIFNFFGPLFIILDVIRGIIDVLCALFNPFPAVASIVELFVTILPPVIALYPPFATILLALNVAKIVTAIVVAMIAHITPIIDLLVSNALGISGLLTDGNLGAVDSVTAKICGLIALLTNEISSLAPIKFILELLGAFMELGSKFFCVRGSPCCDSENCPSIIINPPTGRAEVIRSTKKFTMLDLLNLGFEASSSLFNAITDLINAVILAIQEPFDNMIEGITAFISNTIDFVDYLIEKFNSIPGVPNLNFEFNADAITNSLAKLNIPSLTLDLPTTLVEAIEFIPIFESALAAIGLNTKNIESIFDSIVFVKPEIEIKFLMSGGNNVVSSENENGLISEKGVGSVYTIDELLPLQNYIIDPDKIPASQDEKFPATLRCNIIKRDIRGSIGINETLPIAIPPKTFFGNYIVYDTDLDDGSTFTASIFPGDRLVINTDSFKKGDIVEFAVEPDFIALLSLNLIGLGCHPDIQAAANGFKQLIDIDNDSYTVFGGSGSDSPGSGEDEGKSGFDPLSSKIGGGFPEPPLEELQACIALQAADPSVNQLDCFTDTLGTYLQDITEFYDSILCVGSSRIQSPFYANKNFAVADGEDSIQITLGVNDAGGQNLLLGVIPTSTFRVEWSTTLGTFGPTIFDDTTGLFHVTLTSKNVGKVDVFAAFIINDKVCMRPGNFDGFVVTDNILKLEFIPEASNFPRQRKNRQYVQSRGGRRR